MTSFRVTEVDLEACIVRVEITLPTGGLDAITLHPAQIAATDNDEANSLEDAIRQMVNVRLAELYPPQPPRPAALLGMVGISYQVGE